MLERRAGNGRENVDGNRKHVERTQLKCQIDAIAFALPHPDDAARADVHANRACVHERFDFVSGCMCRAEFSEIRFTRLKIAVITHDACFKETLQFLLSQQTRAQAHLKIRFLANNSHEFNCFAHFTRRELSAARHERKPRETVCLCLFCSFERLVGIDERIDGNACDKTPRLGAPSAVFRTTA